MPLHKRRAVFVKIDGGRCNGIFCVDAVREFTAALKNPSSTMYFHHSLQQQLDNFWVEIAANQHFGGGSDERHVIRRNVAVNINHASWQYQSNEIWKYNGESLCIWKAHEPNVGIVQQRLDGRRIRRAEDPYSIHLVIIQRLDCGCSCKRQQRRGFRIYTALAKDVFGRKSSAASCWSYGNTFAFQLRQPVKWFIRGIKEPKWVVVYGSQRQQSWRVLPV